MLKLFRDVELQEPLLQVEVAGKQFHRFELPRNTPGNTVRASFYLFNDSVNPVEDVQILHDNSQVEFVYKDWVAPKEASEVLVEWRAPLGFKKALTLHFTLKAVEVVAPQI